MPCPDFVNARPEKSVPPKKSWRSHNLTSPERQTIFFSALDPADNLPLGMGPSTLNSDSQNDEGFRRLSSPKNPFEDIPLEDIPLEDIPLDFSLKPQSKSRLAEDRDARGGQPTKANLFAHPFRIPNGERNGRHLSHTPNETRPRFSPTNVHGSVKEPSRTVASPDGEKRNGNYFVANNSADHADFGVRFSPRNRTNSPPSPHLQSPSSSSKSPILAGMLAGNTPDILSGMPMEVLNPRLMPFANGYPKGLNSLCVPGGNSNSVIANPALYPPSNILVAPGLAFMQGHVNMLPSVSPIPVHQGKMDTSKASRKVKQERPFKNYDVSLQDDLQCNTMAWPVIPPLPPRAVDEGSPPDVHRTELGMRASSPNQTGTSVVNGNSENSLHSDPPDFDNAPHSSNIPNHAFEETTGMDKGGGRKRKPVADSEKDASYWERRKKNNQAAKRSRENRRIKEDTVAQQALYFRSEAARLSQLVLHLNARIHDVSMKCASLEQDKLTLTAENAMYKQSLAQKRCGECGNPLANKLL